MENQKTQATINNGKSKDTSNNQQWKIKTQATINNGKSRHKQQSTMENQDKSNNQQWKIKRHKQQLAQDTERRQEQKKKINTEN